MNELESGKKILISVCIATYQRPKLLENLLKSLEVQELPEYISLEIVVVDNDSDGSAKKILQKLNDSDKIRFKYFIQPEKNISLTRNMCIDNASGNFLCFIDDDETASDYWIGKLYNSLVKYDADGVFGYVVPVFENEIPRQFKHRELYFSVMGETGSIACYQFTTNCIIKTELLNSENPPFAPEYGLTGGEDVHLFEKLMKKGAKFINCMEAVSYEFIPKERATKKYLYNRALRGGQAFVRRKIELNKRVYYKLIILNRALIALLISIILYLIFIIKKEKKIKYIQNLGASIGKIRALFGILKILH